MELVRRDFFTNVREFFLKVDRDNLFLLASSISYYSAVAIAPFLLILLSVTSLLGGNVQERVIKLASDSSPQVGQLIQLIIQNVNREVSFSSVSGIIGLGVLLFTASLVFLQIRYAFDVIYGHHERRGTSSFVHYLYERLFAMLVVYLAGLFLILTSTLPGLARLFGDNRELFLIGAFAINLLIYISMFWGIHFFIPSKRPKKRDAFFMAILSSFFFILGNTLLAIYFKEVATSSIYGAAGTLLVFLVWTYYSSLTLFLSVELYLFVKKNLQIRL